MKRIHLFEFEDQSWFPDFLRNYLTDFLQFAANKGRIYDPIVPLLAERLRQDNTEVIIDIGSGGGGGLLSLNAALKKVIPGLTITLTDLYPNKEAFLFTARTADNFVFVADPVDARNVPKHLRGLRTQFLSLHHFKLADARAILQDAVDSGNSIAVFEAQERSPGSILAMLVSPISVLLLTPFIRPFKLGRLVFTYLIPIVPLVVLWDGVVSAFRTYSVPEMRQLIKQLDRSETYRWAVDRIPSGLGVILYLIGHKVDKGEISMDDGRARADSGR